MLLVPNISPKDWQLAIKNLKWQKELDDRVDFDCLLAYDQAVPQHVVEEAKAVAGSLYRKVSLFPYPTPENRSWPAAPNYVWQNCARFIAHFCTKLGNQEWIKLCACLNCDLASYKASLGCSACSQRTIRSIHASDRFLLKQFEKARQEINTYLDTNVASEQKPA